MERVKSNLIKKYQATHEYNIITATNYEKEKELEYEKKRWESQQLHSTGKEF